MPLRPLPSLSAQKALDAMIWSARGSSPGMTNSSPVAIIATSGRRVTVTSAQFIDAIRPRSTPRKRRGALIWSPARKSCAWGANIGAIAQAVQQRDRVTIPADIFLNNHMGAPFGHRRAGEDAHGFSRHDTTFEHVARRGLACDSKKTGRARPVPPPHIHPWQRQRMGAGHGRRATGAARSTRPAACASGTHVGRRRVRSGRNLCEGVFQPKSLRPPS